MKIVLSFVSIMWGIYSFSQTYQFDQLVTTELKGANNLIHTDQALFNSSTSHYRLLFCHNSLAELHDDIKQEVHFFSYTTGTNDQVYFKYLYSEKYRLKNKELNTADYRIEKISEKEFVLGKYRSEKAKRPEILFRIFLEESEKTQLGFFGHISEFEEILMNELDSSKNYLIKKMIFYPHGRKGKTADLVRINESELQLSLPEKLVYK